MTTTIRVERSYDCEPARVWDAWTKPDLMDRWFCPNPDLRLSSHADAREGGAYRVNMGGEYIVSGSYTYSVPVQRMTPQGMETEWLERTISLGQGTVYLLVAVALACVVSLAVFRRRDVTE